MVAYCIPDKSSLQDREIITFNNTNGVSLKKLTAEVQNIYKRKNMNLTVIEFYKNSFDEEPIKIIDFNKGETK